MSRNARIFVAEALGTMILILGGPGAVIFGSILGLPVGPLGVSLAFGLSLLCAAYRIGSISGCHINPAVTIGLWAMKKTESKAVPFYILGQVNSPGSYPYVSGMDVRQAIAIAGGFTRRARTSAVTVIRQTAKGSVEIDAKPDAPVLPGDTIEVERRLF